MWRGGSVGWLEREKDGSTEREGLQAVRLMF